MIKRPIRRSPVFRRVRAQPQTSSPLPSTVGACVFAHDIFILSAVAGSAATSSRRATRRLSDVRFSADGVSHDFPLE
ncbi:MULTISPECIES: hypothetical protein [Lonsdalea]|nr:MULTISPECIES: hypothetical protein [Lonsdalea]QPQ24864.1 hypothetical protein I6N93_03410 [Lonsdalea populi]